MNFKKDFMDHNIFKGLAELLDICYIRPEILVVGDKLVKDLAH